MKLATYKDGSRDGQLVVVSSDLATAHHASAIASRLQQVLDDWAFLAPQLQDLSRTLDEGKARHAFPFEPRMCMAPLARAHRAVEAQHADDGEVAWQALPGDGLLGPHDDVALCRLGGEAEVAPRWIVLSGEVPLGASPEQALDGVRLVGAGLQWLQPQDPAGARPWLSLAPVVVTPDELPAGRGASRGRVALTLEPQGLGVAAAPDGGEPAISPPLGPLMARLAQARVIRAGTLLALGPRARATGPAERVALTPQAARGQTPLGTIDAGLRRLGGG
ncbi:fumarylacetoacetate hydrolase [Sphaerotilus uruguayifluvii]|uniref:Fumarylacetoacetate (FAA) hydrolase n=1 Tax=Sphaerotilus uruguayifluvii TaxID=2735897 RepID=A0ABX2G714_9BURK|nr:fumarylacetoacetate hydrolase [Leptothrix sp. C29]NRT58125.1 fumarylacetoacetate (FAA) hydrolase [Leptothrix sp. C29]